MTARRVIIAGDVQQVGYRDWMVAQAQRLGVHGWVRNRARERTVEALVSGEEAAVQALLSACRRGPPKAMVASITEEFADPPEEPGFHRLPTVR